MRQERSEPARERRMALYKTDRQQPVGVSVAVLVKLPNLSELSFLGSTSRGLGAGSW